MSDSKFEETGRLIIFIILSGILVYAIYVDWENWGWIIFLMFLNLLKVGIAWKGNRDDG